MAGWTDRIRKASRGLRFRLTLGYAVLFTLILALVGILFRGALIQRLEENIHDGLNQEWAAMKGYVRIEKGFVDWVFDAEDPDEAAIVARLKRVYAVADANGRIMEASALYSDIGLDSPDEIRKVVAGGVKTAQPVWSERWSPQGTPYLIRAGVVFANDRVHDAYFVALGRSLADNRNIAEQFTRLYLGTAPFLVFAACLLGWLQAGRALTPVMEVARAAERITGSNLSLRIPGRHSGDELDTLIETFNRMIGRLENSFSQIRQFSTDVSHELRTPITAIRGQLEVALFTAQDTEQYRDAIVNALQDTERLSEIVRVLLLLAQSESGQVVLQRTVQDVGEMVGEVMEQFGLPAEEAGVTLETSLEPGCLAEADRVQIERLVSNLVSNAVKFTPAGGTIRVEVKRSARGVELRVADTGRGIAPEHLPHIFDRFYRVPESQPALEKGLGLGLSFVAWIAKAHGGTIDVESRPGEGTRFTVVLAAAEAPASLAAPAAMNEL